MREDALVGLEFGNFDLFFFAIFLVLDIMITEFCSNRAVDH